MVSCFLQRTIRGAFNCVGMRGKIQVRSVIKTIAYVRRMANVVKCNIHSLLSSEH